MKRISTFTNLISMMVVAGVLLGIGQSRTLAGTHLYAGFEDVHFGGSC